MHRCDNFSHINFLCRSVGYRHTVSYGCTTLQSYIHSVIWLYHPTVIHPQYHRLYHLTQCQRDSPAIQRGEVHYPSSTSAASPLAVSVVQLPPGGVGWPGLNMLRYLVSDSCCYPLDARVWSRRLQAACWPPHHPESPSLGVMRQYRVGRGASLVPCQGRRPLQEKPLDTTPFPSKNIFWTS